MDLKPVVTLTIKSVHFDKYGCFANVSDDLAGKQIAHPLQNFTLPGDSWRPGQRLYLCVDSAAKIDDPEGAPEIAVSVRLSWPNGQAISTKYTASNIEDAEEELRTDLHRLAAAQLDAKKWPDVLVDIPESKCIWHIGHIPIE